MIRSIGSYSTIVFDCDGVILDSNRVKSDAFRVVALPWGEGAANDLVDYHMAHGGVSRYSKFSYFLETILPKYLPSAIPHIYSSRMDELLSRYSQAVYDGLMTCSISEGLESLREQTSSSNWCIVSGGDQHELRNLFSQRRLDHLFDGGIYGSPDNKEMILSRELAEGTIRLPALFIGDSRYDHVVSEGAGLDFIFMSSWTDVINWPEYVSANHLRSIHSLSDLLQA